MTHNLTGYSTHHCRCDECKAAWAEYQREYYQTLKANRTKLHRHDWRKHGKSRAICKLCRVTAVKERAIAERAA